SRWLDPEALGNRATTSQGGSPSFRHHPTATSNLLFEDTDGLRLDGTAIRVRAQVQGIGEHKEFAAIQNLVFRVTISVTDNGHAVSHSNLTGQQQLVTGHRVHGAVELGIADEVLHEV